MERGPGGVGSRAGHDGAGRAPREEPRDEELSEDLRWFELQAFMSNSLAEIHEKTSSVEKHILDLHTVEGLRADTESDSAASTADGRSEPSYHAYAGQKRGDGDLDQHAEQAAHMRIAMEALRNGDYSKLAVITSSMVEGSPESPGLPSTSNNLASPPQGSTWNDLASPPQGRRRQWSATQRKDLADKPSWRRPESAPAKRPDHVNHISIETNDSSAAKRPDYVNHRTETSRQEDLRKGMVNGWTGVDDEEKRTPKPPAGRPGSAPRRRDGEVYKQGLVGHGGAVKAAAGCGDWDQQGQVSSGSSGSSETPPPETPSSHGQEDDDRAKSSTPFERECPSAQTLAGTRAQDRGQDLLSAESSQDTSHDPVKPSSDPFKETNSRTLQTASDGSNFGRKSSAKYGFNNVLGNDSPKVSHQLSATSGRPLLCSADGAMQAPGTQAAAEELGPPTCEGRVERDGASVQSDVTKSAGNGAAVTTFGLQREVSDFQHPTPAVHNDTSSDASSVVPTQQTPLVKFPSVLRLELDARIEAKASQKADEIKHDMEARVTELEMRVREEIGAEAVKLRRELDAARAREALLVNKAEHMGNSVDHISVGHVHRVEDNGSHEGGEHDEFRRQLGAIPVLSEDEQQAAFSKKMADGNGVISDTAHNMDLSECTRTITIAPRGNLEEKDVQDSLTSIVKLGANVVASPQGSVNGSDIGGVLSHSPSTHSTGTAEGQNNTPVQEALSSVRGGLEGSSESPEEPDAQAENDTALQLHTIQEERNTKVEQVKTDDSPFDEPLLKPQDQEDADVFSDGTELAVLSEEGAESVGWSKTGAGPEVEDEREDAHAARVQQGNTSGGRPQRDTSFSTALVCTVKADVIQERHERDFGDMGVNMDEWEAHETLKRRRQKYNKTSLFFLKLTNPIRRRAIWIAEWKWFDRFILLTIATNCAFMASDDPENQDPTDALAILLKQMSIVFQAIFTFELVVKVLTLGLFFGPNTYLRDGWNCLDAFIVISGMLEYLPTGGTDNSSVILRTFRLLRPLRALRAVGRFKDLRMLVELLISCIPMLVNVFGLISFIFFVFGILGVQLWGGYLRGRCYHVESGNIDFQLRDEVCSEGGGYAECSEGFQCLKLYYNPFFDVISFDGIGGAMIIIFQVMIQEQWTDIMYTVWDSYSFWTWPYFIFLNMVGPMFAIQLFLVVVANKYADAKQRQVEAENAAVSLYEVKVGIVTANLPRGKASISIDPYVKVQVDDKHKKTRTLKNTSVPEWNEYFVFPVSSVSSRCRITMYKWVRGGPHVVLGTLTVPVGTLDEMDEGSDKWYELVLEDGSAVEGLLHVRTQWRRSDADEWVPLPEIADEDMPEEEDAEDEDKNCLGHIKTFFKYSAESRTLNNTTILIIILNMITMAADHDCDLVADGYCLEFKAALELTNIVFTSFFAIEMITKIFGLGFVNYLKEMANVFDVVIVIMSIVELPSVISTYLCYTTTADPATACAETSNMGMSVLRSFRLVRVLRIGKLVRAFPQIQRQLKVITRTIGAVSSLVALILLFILIFAILGMSLFGGVGIDRLDSADADGVSYFRPGVFVRVLDPGDPRMHTARLFAFNASHFNGAGTDESPLVYAPYQLHPWNKEEETFWISHAQDVNPTFFEETAAEIHETLIIGIRPRDGFDTFFFACLTVFQLLTTSDIGDAMYPALRGAGMISTFYFVGLVVIGNFMLFNLFVAIIITGFSETKAMIQKEERENQRMIEADKLRKAQSIARGQSLGQSSVASTQKEGPWNWFQKKVLKRKATDGDLVTAEDLKEKVKLAKQQSFQSDVENMFAARDTSNLHWSRRIIENRFFTMFILFCIFLSSISLALQRPSTGDIENEVVKYVNLTVNYIFLVECIFKIYALTFKKYIKSRWNQLDFFLVVTSMTDVIVDSLGISSQGLATFKFLRIFRIFRALRPLRVISRAKGLKIVLGTVARAIVPVMNTVAIALCVFFVFGIMAVQLIGSNTFYCTDPFVLTKEECVGTDSDGNALEWRNRDMQYNWIGRAMLSMFVLASQDNWQCSMYAAMDATGRDTGPYVDSNPALALYFIAFMIVGSFFVIQLFVGVFIDTFQTVTSETKALSRQGSIASERSSTTAAGFQEPMNSVRSIIFEVVTMTQFDITIAIFIVFNVIVMASEAYQQGMGQQAFLSTSDFVFNFVFGTEVISKLTGLYPKQYFQSRWNRFDFIVVMISFFGIAMDLQGASLALNPTILRVLRIFRIFRILRAFRIFKAAEGLQKLVRTLIRSLNAVGNLGALLLLLFFIVGILTVELFGNLCVSGKAWDHTPGKIDRCLLVDDLDVIDNHATFESLGMALLTLFRISTSDNWSQIMTATMKEPVTRPSGGEATARAKEAIEMFLQTRNETFLHALRYELPGCQSEDDLTALQDLVSCEYPTEFGTCPSTCGDQFTSSVIFSFFLCASNFILLNLVMAVLMQELQEAMTMSTKTKSSLNVLMSVSAATNKWLKKVGEDGNASTCDNPMESVDAKKEVAPIADKKTA